MEDVSLVVLVIFKLLFSMFEFLFANEHKSNQRDTHGVRGEKGRKGRRKNKIKQIDCCEK